MPLAWCMQFSIVICSGPYNWKGVGPNDQNSSSWTILHELCAFEDFALAFQDKHETVKRVKKIALANTTPVRIIDGLMVRI